MIFQKAIDSRNEDAFFELENATARRDSFEDNNLCRSVTGVLCRRNGHSKRKPPGEKANLYNMECKLLTFGRSDPYG